MVRTSSSDGTRRASPADRRYSAASALTRKRSPSPDRQVTGEVDLSNPTGRLVARMLGAAARHEAEHKAERQKRQRRQAAEAGRVAGGLLSPKLRPWRRTDG